MHSSLKNLELTDDELVELRPERQSVGQEDATIESRRITQIIDDVPSFIFNCNELFFHLKQILHNYGHGGLGLT